jgi:eukaryotic-like serine/threonine-protein kinase
MNTHPSPNPEFLALQQALAGRYSLDRELGRGGMGIVFLARDVALDRPVAIKLLLPRFASTPDLQERFWREAQTAAKLSHPNIVPIHVVEESDGLFYFVMAYVDGESLGQRVRRTGPPAPSVVTKIVQEVAWALAYAHKHGVVHRDIKPDNILLEKGSGRAMVSDFGIARVTEGGTMTGKGELIGTVRYMSPEHATGDAVDGRSDLYSLGVTAFYALSGQLPFDGPNLPAIIHKHVAVAPPRVGAVARAVPPPLAEAVDRCLAKDPAARFPSGEALADAVGTAEARAEVPAAIRGLLRQIREMGVLWGSLVGLLWLFGKVLDTADPTMRFLVLILLAAYLVVPPLQLVSTERKILRGGLGHADVRRALLADGRAKREELLVLKGEAAVERLVKRQRDPRAPEAALPRLDRLLAGRLGQWLFRLAGLGTGAAKESTTLAPDRTELILGAVADRLYEELPTATRRRLGEVPSAIEHLQGHVGELRDREAALSRAIAGVDTSAVRPAAGEGHGDVVAELDDARAAVRLRLTSAVAALENVRLGLLRLHAGVGSPDNLTEDLVKAREIGDAIDAELAGRAEVDDLLASTLLPPTTLAP